MVERYSSLDLKFNSLADPTRRDILMRVATRALTISDLASAYSMSFAAVAKHIQVLVKAGLVSKQRHGKERIVQLSPAAFKEVNAYLEANHRIWNSRLDSLEAYLKASKEEYEQ